LEGTPANIHAEVRADQAGGLLQPPFADVAPGADRVGDDLDGERGDGDGGAGENGIHLGLRSMNSDPEVKTRCCLGK
jgi:hypothetical protein